MLLQVNLILLSSLIGVTGAAGRAVRAAEIKKATGIMKAAKEGVKMGRLGMAATGIGCVFSLVDIVQNINELADGSIPEEAQSYHDIADHLEAIIKDVQKLLSVNIK